MSIVKHDHICSNCREGVVLANCDTPKCLSERSRWVCYRCERELMADVMIDAPENLDNIIPGVTS